MARKASIEKNNKKKALSTKFFKYRTELRSKAVDVKLSDEERDAARKNLLAVLVEIIENLDYHELHSDSWL
jgi:small subunit ribosomal protein S14